MRVLLHVDARRTTPASAKNGVVRLDAAADVEHALAGRPSRPLRAASRRAAGGSTSRRAARAGRGGLAPGCSSALGHRRQVNGGLLGSRQRPPRSLRPRRPLRARSARRPGSRRSGRIRSSEPSVSSVSADACDAQVAASASDRAAPPAAGARTGRRAGRATPKSASDWTYAFWTPHGCAGDGKASARLVEAAFRVRDVRLVGVRVRRSLPADAEQRVAEEDAAADVGEQRALPVALDVLPAPPLP